MMPGSAWAVSSLAYQCTTCKAVFTVLPHFVLRYRRMSPNVARQALIATHGGLSLEWCAVICNISPWLSIAWFVPGSAESGGRIDSVWLASAGVYPGR